MQELLALQSNSKGPDRIWGPKIGPFDTPKTSWGVARGTPVSPHQAPGSLGNTFLIAPVTPCGAKGAPLDIFCRAPRPKSDHLQSLHHAGAKPAGLHNSRDRKWKKHREREESGDGHGQEQSPRISVSSAQGAPSLNNHLRAPEVLRQCFHQTLQGTRNKYPQTAGDVLQTTGSA